MSCSKRHSGEGELPPEILATELLPRLPAKSLLRFKSVCKSWRDLISDPHFIESHLHQQSQAASISSNGTIISGPPNLNVLFGKFNVLFSIVVGSGDATAKPIGFDNSYCPLCSCNGLVCVETNLMELALWNPCTQSFRLLPKWKDDLPDLDTERLTCGFGYDAEIKDYKLVVIGRKSGRVSQVLVFTLASNSWRRISDTNLPFYCMEGGMFINGFIYWPVLNYCCDALICFDIHNEVFNELRIPDAFLSQVTRNEEIIFNIGELGGCLVLVWELSDGDPDHNSDLSHEVWILKENWVKMYSINLSKSFCTEYHTPIMPTGVISVSKKKKKSHFEIVYASCNGRLFSYNLSTNRFRHFKAPGLWYVKSRKAKTYIESLVSLHQ
ncbi:hypothetical protein Sjap_007636 [Stephania japonica]|uniref:F-box domain-containing protein n=1 Tax=Stephania japonica TaxID=461633 RepID=A0AAP0JQC6_9MAGN